MEKIHKLDPSKAREMQVLFENEIREAREEARKEAEKERLEALTKVAQKMLKRGLKAEDIAKDFGLSLEDIQKFPKK